MIPNLRLLLLGKVNSPRISHPQHSKPASSLKCCSDHLKPPHKAVVRAPRGIGQLGLKPDLRRRSGSCAWRAAAPSLTARTCHSSVSSTPQCGVLKVHRTTFASQMIPSFPIQSISAIQSTNPINGLFLDANSRRRRTQATACG